MQTRRAILVSSIAFAGCASLVDVIPPDAQTNSGMTETYARIAMYLEHADSLPTSLDALPVRKGYVNRTTDGWNRPLIYNTEVDGFSLTSLGKDGTLGGSGDDADIVKKYRLVNGQPEEIR